MAQTSAGGARAGPALGTADRDRKVRRLLLLEGSANLAVLGAKTAVGLSTGSVAVLGDALHSLTDLVNNGVALVVMVYATRPPDRDHAYGHRKFETLAVFALAGLLSAMAFELVLRALGSAEREVVTSGWGLATMGAVLAVNVAVSTWQARWAKRLDSEILRADAWHTFGDVLTTVAVIAGWQFAAAGWVWMDTLFAVVVAGVVLWLAFNLFRRSVPILVDSSAVDPEDLRRAVESVPGVHEAPRVRSRLTPSAHAADIVITVAPRLTTLQGHAIADEVERLLRERFELQDVVVHLEPRAEQPPGSPGGGGQGA